MPKIEIELAEIEKLKCTIERLEEKIQDRENKLKELNEEELKKRAINLGYFLFHSYMASVFKNLGFDQWNKDSVKMPDIDHWLGKRWYNSDRIEMDICVNVSTKFRNALLTIGITDKKEKDDDDLVL